jgi:hypothetical protein
MEEIPQGKEPIVPLPVIGAALFVLIFCNLFSFLIFEHVPHVNDEIAYLFQAKLFLTGRLSAPSPCARESFDFPHIINNGRWYSIYPPGYPFLLMLGLFLRAPWLVNPLLAAGAIVVFYLLGKEFYNRSVGVLASILGAVSPWYLVMSSTMMSHASSLFFNSLFLLFLFRSLRTSSRLNGWAAGAALGMAVLIRPVNTLLFCLPFLVYYAAHLLKERRGKIRNLAAGLAGVVPFALILLLYNFLTNGNPVRMGYLVRYGQSYSVIFGRAATMDFDYTPLFATAQIADNIRALNSDLFGWPLSSFFAVLPLLWLSRIKREYRKKDLLLGSAVVWLFVGFYFFWGAFVFVGPRMFFDALPLLLLLSARGITELPGLLGHISRKLQPQGVKRLVAVILAGFVFYAFVYHLPRFLRPAHKQWYFDRYDNRFAGTTARLHRAIQEQKLGRAVVILKFLNSPPGSFPDGGWGSGFLHDDPDLKGQIIYARAAEDSWDNLMSCFPGREFYLYVGTLEKGMLLPLEKEGGHILHGQALPPAEKSRGAIALVQNPKSFFRVYSPEFADFLDRVYREQDVAQMDASRLAELGRLNQTQGHFRQATFCFEAALQVENEPETRRVLLGLLLPCYLKTGQAREAKTITRYMEKVHYNERKLYDVLPERGF